MYSAVEGKFCGTPIWCPSCVHSARIQLVIGNANLIFGIVHSSIPNFTMVQENTLPSSIMIYCIGYTWDYTHQSCNECNKRGEGASPTKEPNLVQYCMFFFNYTLSM